MKVLYFLTKDMFKYLIIIFVCNVFSVHSASNITIDKAFENITAGNELWLGLVRDCKKPSLSCIKNSIYDYLKDTLDYDNDVQFTSYMKFTKNSLDFTKIEDKSVDSANNTGESPFEDETPLEEMARSLTDNTKRFFMTHDMEFQLPDTFFLGSTLRVSPRSLDTSGTIVKLELVPREINNSVGEGRIFLKKIRKFISERLLYALLAILLVIKLLAVKVLFVIPAIIGVAAAKKLILKVVLFLFPALHHLFKLCAYTPYGAKHHIHKHQISHLHQIGHKHHHPSHGHGGYVEVISPHSEGPPNLHHFGHKKDNEPYGEPDFYPGNEFISHRNDPEPDENEIDPWVQGQTTRRPKPDNRRPTPTEIENIILKAEKEALAFREIYKFQSYSTGNGFDAGVRVKTDPHEENSAWCDRWIAEFSTKTCTNWIVRYTYPSAIRYIYRKIYKCQHNSFDKVKDRKRKDFRMRDKECNATIDILFKKINRNTIKNDELLKGGFNVCIKIKSRLQKEKQRIHEENLRLQQQLNNALKIQEKLKQQAAKYSGKTSSPTKNYNLSLYPPYRPQAVPHKFPQTSFAEPPENYVAMGLPVKTVEVVQNFIAHKYPHKQHIQPVHQQNQRQEVFNQNYEPPSRQNEIPQPFAPSQSQQFGPIQTFEKPQSFETSRPAQTPKPFDALPYPDDSKLDKAFNTAEPSRFEKNSNPSPVFESGKTEKPSYEDDIDRAASITFDKFYSPILEKVDRILNELEFFEEPCKERLICSMYKDPNKFSPHSNLISAELSRDSEDLQKPTSTNAAVIRFYRYVQAARDGQDKRDCIRLYPSCVINTDT